MIEIAIVLYVIGFLLAFSFEVMTLHIRLAGSIAGQNAYAAFLVTACMLGNRLGASLLFPSGGFLLDRGFKAEGFLLLFAGASLLYSVVLTVLYFSHAFIARQLSRFFSTPASKQSRIESDSREKGVSIPRTVVSLTSTLNQLGIFLPVFVAAFFLDYRATIVQFGFFVNSIGTILNIFFIEKKVALNAEFAPEQLKIELQSILQTRIAVHAALAMIAVAGYIHMSSGSGPVL